MNKGCLLIKENKISQLEITQDEIDNKQFISISDIVCYYKLHYIVLALTRKICGILSKKLQKLALLKLLLSNLSVKTTVFCYFLISHKFYRFRLVVDINIIT